MSDSSYNGGGIGFWGLLTIVFIVLKVLGKINWSWWIVLLPLWVGWSLTVLCIIVGAILVTIFKERKKEEK